MRVGCARAKRGWGTRVGYYALIASFTIPLGWLQVGKNVTYRRTYEQPSVLHSDYSLLKGARHIIIVQATFGRSA